MVAPAKLFSVFVDSKKKIHTHKKKYFYVYQMKGNPEKSLKHFTRYRSVYNLTAIVI